MKLIDGKQLIALLGVLALVSSGCASSSGNNPTPQQFESPQAVTPEPDMVLFTQALNAQNGGQYESAIKLWKSYLAKYPDSFEGHNNMGLIYYTQDSLTQALEEFETAYRLQPLEDKIRKNLARALRFKASMLHENRDYFKTLIILSRLEQIVDPEEKQAIMFKQEQVEDQIFLQVIKADNSAAYQDFVNRFPDGLNAVRAREYLEKHPNKMAHSTSQTKNWISSGKAVANPDGGSSSWASAQKPPEYGTATPMATFTPPSPAAKKKKSGDFFGTDAAAVEEIIEENVAAPQSMDPVAAIPFEDFEKPVRSVDPGAPGKSAVAKETGRMAAEFNPLQESGDGTAPSLDTLADLKPSPIPEAPPVAMETPPAEETVTAEISMPSAETETPDAAPVEAAAAPPAQTAMMPEETLPAPAPAVSPPGQIEESESERIARIVREEIARSEGAPEEQPQVEPVVERPADIEPPMATETPQETPPETPMETAVFDPGKTDSQPEGTPAEIAPAVEEANAELQEMINPETISETVAGLVPPSPVAEGMQTPEETAQPIGSSVATQPMVVIQVASGSTLNVRSKPSTQGEILGYLEQNDMMPFVSESGDWYQIAIEENLSGWVSKKFSTIRNVPKETPVPAQAAASVPAPETELSTELSPELSNELSSSAAEPQTVQDAMVVVDVGEGSILNVRSLPSSSGAVVDMLFRGDKLPLLKEENGWYQVRFLDDTTGWISKKFSFVEGGPRPAVRPAPSLPPVPQKPAVKPWPGTGESEAKKDEKDMITTVVVVKVPEGSTLNVRSTPSSESEVVGSLKSGDMRPLLEESGDWYQVKLENGQSGWISRQFSGKMDLGSSFVQSP